MNKNLRKAVIAGNWKMNKTRAEAKELINELLPKCKNAQCEVIVCVPFTDLETAVSLTEKSNIKVGAQNCHFEKSGAFTGEISAEMLSELSVSYVIIGHSERRQYFAETDETAAKRMRAALDSNIKVILCVGELLNEREQNITVQVIKSQLKKSLSVLKADDLKNIIIAYEPVWAIGTGKTATAEQAEEVCLLIRNVVSNLFDSESALKLRILYGGSMNAKNAAELLSKPDIDGGLIGGAALKSADFSGIVAAADKN